MVFLSLLACAPDPTDTAARPDRGPCAGAQDLLDEALRLDVSTHEGAATITACPGPSALRLDVSGLDVKAVTVDGAEAASSLEGGWLHIPVDDPTRVLTVDVRYTFPDRTIDQFDGWMPSLGVSFVWPYSCGNLFPCDPSLEDGITFSVAVDGVPDGQRAISAVDGIPGDAPAYMPALAVGNYEEEVLGSTRAGTRVHAFHFPEDAAASAAGTAHLVDAMDFFETTYGAYSFGSDVGTVEVDWGGDSWGGMEHHPYFHVGRFDTDDEEATIHEAGHAWFGDGVRIGCWEDFVLSEGTNSYITARAMESVGAQPEPWAYYVDDFLEPICTGADVNTVVMRDGCGEIDFLNDNLWSLATYMKGACFYEEVGDIVGVAELDAIIAEFYQANVGGAAHMGEMIDLIESRADGADVDAIEAAKQDWLLSYACPDNYAQRCRTHGVR